MQRARLPFILLSLALMSTIIVGALFGQAADKDNLYRNLSLFTEVIELVDNSYVDEVDQERLIEGAFAGVTEAIDEYSFYVPPASMADYERVRVLDDPGVGLIISKRLGYAYVIATIAGSPAEREGIVAGDFIERINGNLTTDMPVWKIEAALRFFESDRVEMTIVRAGMAERERFTFEQEDYEIDGPRLSWDEGDAILVVPQFSAGTADLVAAILEEVGKRKTDRLLIDLRGNAWGEAEEAIRTADLFMEEGVITSTEGRRIEPQEWNAEKGSSWNGSTVVLVDTSTAGPAEVFAAALSRNGVARLVGVPTYGKMPVRQFVRLGSGGGLEITVGHYQTPDGMSIVEGGVRPDIVINRAALALSDEDEDLILDRGLAILRSEPEGA
ncbi:MAG: hypothetical protein KY459_14690 [Acidobacteria bacterium]|nr:hypothetical protein [Acidobacteriota bacterium]